MIFISYLDYYRLVSEAHWTHSRSAKSTVEPTNDSLTADTPSTVLPADHDTAIRILGSRANILSAICRLPPEILSNIFIMYAYLFPPHSFGSRRYQWLGWIKITHVCRHFRYVALGCPGMWTRISFTSHALTAEMLKRSKKASLVLNITRDIDRRHLTRLFESVKTALQEIPRIEEITMEGIEATSLKTFFTGLDVEAPRLRSLRVSGIGYGTRFQFSGTFLARGTPRLESLEIRHCYIPWSDWVSTLFSSRLSILSLKHVCGVTKPTLSQLLHILQCMPGLKSLELAALSLQDIHLSERVVPLSRLECLYFDGWILECRSLLDSLYIPSITDLTLEVKLSRDAAFNTAVSLTQTLKKSYGATMQPRALTMACHTSDFFSLSIRAQDLIPCDNVVSVSGSSLLEHRLPIAPIDGDVTQARLEEIPDMICRSFQLEYLSCLDLNSVVGISEDSWLNYFARLPSLSRINMTRTKATGLFQAMDPRESDHRSEVPFPVLRILSLRQVDLGYIHASHSLQNILAARAECQVKLQKLLLREVDGLDKKEVERLQCVVDHTNWDRSVWHMVVDDEAAVIVVDDDDDDAIIVVDDD